VVNWAWWDNVITNPKGGSDYWWSGDANLWQGNARTVLGALHNAGVRVVMTLRNVDNNKNPAWAAQLNPPNTTAGQNEWWEHAFATVYELDVRNNYGIDDWEIHNEPDNSAQGWAGTLADYEAFATLTADAIRYVYATYLPGRTPHIYAPVTTGGSSWPDSVMKAVPGAFDSVDVHDHQSDITSYITTVHNYMDADGLEFPRFGGHHLTERVSVGKDVSRRASSLSSCACASAARRSRARARARSDAAIPRSVDMSASVWKPPRFWDCRAAPPQPASPR
jgi:hypothetical protein